MRDRQQWGCMCVVIVLILCGVVPAGAAGFANGAFAAQWQTGEALTPNFWGPLKNATAALQEPYLEASLGYSEGGPTNPGQGMRLVQYFDKGRMEITAPASGKVTNGLLAMEIVTGQIQVGNSAFQAKAPPAIPIAGDPDNAGPTYADLSGKAAVLLNPTPAKVGSFITTMVAPDGTVSDGGGFAGISLSPKIAVYDDATKHNVLDRFATYRTKVSLGAIGYARSEPFRAMVKVAGQQQSVIAQVFERRVLTYTASNPVAFQVEFGNIGQHYYQWRYTGTTPMPAVVGAEVSPTTVASGDPTTAAAQLLPAGFTVKNVRAVDLGGDGGQQAVGVAENANAQGNGQIAFLLTLQPGQGGQWTLAFRTQPDRDAIADISAYPKNAQHPGFVTASYHNCGANCNSGEHFVLRYDGSNTMTQVLRGGDDRGAIKGDPTSGQVSLAAPLYRTRDARCCPGYQYRRVWSWNGGVLSAGPFAFAVPPDSMTVLPDWLKADGAVLFPFLSVFQPTALDTRDGAPLANALSNPLPVTNLRGVTCMAPAVATGNALAGITLAYIGGLWKDGADYKATLDLSSESSGGSSPTAQAGSCTLGGAGIGGYVLTISVNTQGARVVAMRAVAETYNVIPDDAIEVPPV